jgi:hypothetical protein
MELHLHAPLCLHSVVPTKGQAQLYVLSSNKISRLYTKDDGIEYTRADITVTHKLRSLLVVYAAVLLTHTGAPHSEQSTVSC